MGLLQRISSVMWGWQNGSYVDEPQSAQSTKNIKIDQLVQLVNGQSDGSLEKPSEDWQRLAKQFHQNVEHRQSSAFLHEFRNSSLPVKLKLFKSLQDEIGQMHRSIAVINRISLELDFASAVEGVREAVREILDCEKVTLYLINERQQIVWTKVIEDGQEILISLNFGEGIAGMVALTGEMYHIDNAQSNILFSKLIDERTGFTTRNILCCPIYNCTGKRMAVLQALNKLNAEKFTEHDCSALALFGVHLGNMLSKSQLHESIIREQKRLDSLVKYFKSFSSASDLQDLLGIARQATKDILTAEHCVIFIAERKREHFFSVGLDQQDEVQIQAIFRRQDSVVGRAALSLQQISFLGSDVEVQNDQILRKLVKELQIEQIKELLIQPVVLREDCVGLLLAINKFQQSPVQTGSKQGSKFKTLTEQAGFSQEDKHALGMIAMDFCDHLEEYELEISYTAALVGSKQMDKFSGSSLLIWQPQTDLETDMLRAQLGDYSMPKGNRQLRKCATMPSTTRTNSVLQPKMSNSFGQLSVMPITSAYSTGGAGPLVRYNNISQVTQWDVAMIDFPADDQIHVAFDIIINSVNLNEFCIEKSTLMSFVRQVAHMYNTVPYHNFTHALFVLQGVFLLLRAPEFTTVVSSFDKLCLLIAALCHDIDHDGRTNSYHVNSSSNLALTYNDASVLENHHCAVTFKLLNEDKFAVLRFMPKQLQRKVRKRVIDLVMATDMMHHTDITKEFQSHPLSFDPEIEPDIVLLSKVFLHVADISNPVRPFDTYLRFSELVNQEFKAQVEQERSQGLPVAPHMDIRDNIGKIKMEISFVELIVRPIWEHMTVVAPSLEVCLAQLDNNLQRLAELHQSHLEFEMNKMQEVEYVPKSGGNSLTGSSSTIVMNPSSAQQDVVPTNQGTSTSVGTLKPQKSFKEPILSPVTSPGLSRLGSIHGSEASGGSKSDAATPGLSG